jgi:hypothetical protein
MAPILIGIEEIAIIAAPTIKDGAEYEALGIIADKGHGLIE